MGYALQKSRLSADEFLAWEATQAERHEFVQGEVFAMAGGEDRNNTVAGNLYIALRQHLRGTPCRALMEGVKLYLKKERSYFYPDVMVTCESRLLELDAQMQIVDSPTLIIEVLSPSTEGIDRREKLRAYRTLPSLKEYALVSQDECKVELHRRRGDIGWDIITFEPGDAVEFASVELQMPIADIYFEAGVACSG